MNLIKGSLKKVEKAVTEIEIKAVYTKSTIKINIFRVFCFLILSPKQNREAINPHPGNQKRTRNEKRLQKTPTRKLARQHRCFIDHDNEV